MTLLKGRDNEERKSVKKNKKNIDDQRKALLKREHSNTTEHTRDHFD